MSTLGWDIRQTRVSIVPRYFDAGMRCRRWLRTLRESQFRYKAAHDARVKEKSRSVQVDDFVYVNWMFLEGGKSPKLTIAADELYEVGKVHSHTFVLGTATGLVTISSDRVTKAPVSTEPSWPSTILYASQATRGG